MPSSRAAVPGGLRMIPPSMNPTSAMNRPIPTEIAARRDRGTARKTAVRKPVSTRTRMMIPSQTTSPMAWGQVIVGGAITYASSALRPSPVAMATGYRPTTPIRMVITPGDQCGGGGHHTDGGGLVLRGSGGSARR